VTIAESALTPFEDMKDNRIDSKIDHAYREDLKLRRIDLPLSEDDASMSGWTPPNP
jgi:serine protease inhibitor